MTKSTLFVLVLAGASVSRIAPIAAQPAPAPAANPAEKLMQEGRAHYDLREWDLAIAKFKEAYRLRPDAASLFNIAQSYRLKGDCGEAASFYKTFKRNFPTEKNIDKVDKFIVEMEACAKSQKADPTTTYPTTPTDPGGTNPTGTNPTGTTPTNPVGTTPTNPTGVTSNPAIGPTGPSTGPIGATPAEGGSPGRGLRIGGLVVGGVGVACLVGGVISGMSAKSTASDVEDLPVFDPELHDKGERANRRAKILLGVGAGALVTGGVLFFVGMKQGERSSAVSFVPQTDGGMVVWSGKL